MNISPGVRKPLVELFPYPRNPADTGKTATARLDRADQVPAYAVAR
jgi:hypothetical protein